MDESEEGVRGRRRQPIKKGRRAVEKESESDDDATAKLSRRRITSKRRKVEESEEDVDMKSPVAQTKEGKSAETKTPRKRSGYASADEAQPNNPE